MRIDALMENTTSRNDIFAEHGLSLYIETEGHKILFDTGQSDLFAKNAEQMGIDLAKVDMAVLSHGHYDHGGGLKTFLNLNKTAPIFANRHAFEPHYHGPEKYIGLDSSLLSSERFHFVGDNFLLDENLSLSSCNEQSRPYGTDSFGLTVLSDGKLIPDDFTHEQYLLIQENGQKILISGCSHKGILNIMEWFHPDILVGGFHLKKLDPAADKEQLVRIAERLTQYHAQYYTCHCTGTAQYQVMKGIMGNQLHYLSAGEHIIL